MADSSIVPFLDQLLAKVETAVAEIELEESDNKVWVYDGYPGPNQPEQIVAIGGSITPTVTDTQRWAQLGNLAIWEEYEIECIVATWVGGDDNDASFEPGDAQMVARHQAFQIFNAIAEALRADPNFAQQNGGQPLVLWCIPTRIEVQQSNVSDAGRGRACQIRWYLYVKNRIARQ